VFADPPYDVADTEIAQMLTALVEGGWAAAGTVVVVERPTSGPQLTWPDGWRPWPARPLRRHTPPGVGRAWLIPGSSPSQAVGPALLPAGPDLHC